MALVTATTHGAGRFPPLARPVFNQESQEVVGVAFAGRDRAEGHGYVIPVMVVQRFLSHYESTRSPNFGKLPTLGLTVGPLINPSLRRWARPRLARPRGGR